MPVTQPGYDKTYINRSLEASIHIGLAVLLVASCILILRPFIPLTVWGIIIAVALYPSFEKLKRILGGRGVWSAVIFTVGLLAILILPVFFLGQGLVEGGQTLISRVKSGAPIVPPPPPTINAWPIIGAPLSSLWGLASTDLTQTLKAFSPQIKSVLPGVLSVSAGLGLTVVQLLASIILSGIILANAQAAYEVTRSLTNRLFGARGPEFQRLLGSTIRSVTFGILGVALIQALFATIGFFVVGLSGASVWSMVFLFGAVLQLGGIVLIPAVIYVFATATTTKAVIFMVWCAIVGLSDNILKPMLLGRGVEVPVAVVFLGAIGGFMAMGIIGLFVGAIVLSVGYKLFLAWLGQDTVAETTS